MSIGSGIINGAAQGLVAGTAIRNARDAREAQDKYSRLLRKYNDLMDERNEFAQKIYDMQQAIKNLMEERDAIAADRRETALALSDVNSTVLGGLADRTKAYEFIIEMAHALRQFDPDNKLLTNPNNVLSQINAYSAQRMKESAEKMYTELRAGGYTQFSRTYNDKQFNSIAKDRIDRAAIYKEAADKGIYEVDEEVSPTY